MFGKDATAVRHCDEGAHREKGELGTAHLWKSDTLPSHTYAVTHSMQAALAAYIIEAGRLSGCQFAWRFLNALRIAHVNPPNNTLIVTGGEPRIGRSHALAFFIHTWLDHHDEGKILMFLPGSTSLGITQFRDQVGAVGDGRLDLRSCFADRTSARNLSSYAMVIVEVMGFVGAEFESEVLPTLLNSPLPVIMVQQDARNGDRQYLEGYADVVMYADVY